MIRDVSPEHAFSVHPIVEWTARSSLEKGADSAPGCPEGMEASRGGTLKACSDSASLSRPTRQAGRRAAPVRRLSDGGRGTTRDCRAATCGVVDLFALWTANMMLRSRGLRVWNGNDLAAQQILPALLDRAGVGPDDDARTTAATMLQFGCALVTSDRPEAAQGSEVLMEARDLFLRIGAEPLWSLADVLRVPRRKRRSLARGCGGARRPRVRPARRGSPSTASFRPRRGLPGAADRGHACVSSRDAAICAVVARRVVDAPCRFRKNSASGSPLLARKEEARSERDVSAVHQHRHRWARARDHPPGNPPPLRRRANG